MDLLIYSLRISALLYQNWRISTYPNKNMFASLNVAFSPDVFFGFLIFAFSSAIFYFSALTYFDGWCKVFYL